MAKPMSTPWWVWGLMVAAGVMALSSYDKTSGDPEQAAEPGSVIQEVTNTAAPAVGTYTPSWNYSVVTDQMSSKEIRFAAIQSTNTVSFDFPYQGEQQGTLQLRRHPRYGNDVIFFVKKGQINIGYRETAVLIRFYDEPAMRFSAYEPDDHDRTTIFIDGFGRFTKKLKSASVVRIEVPFYQAGNRVFEFNASKYLDTW